MKDFPDLPPIEQFFTDFFYADDLEDPSDLRAAINEYLRSNRRDDPGGKRLLAQVEELIARNLDDRQLAELIERWEPHVYLSLLGQSYNGVLVQMRGFLRDQG